MKRTHLFVFGIIFVFIHLIGSYFAPQLLSQSFFPYLDDLQKSGLPHFLYSFGNFDGTIYLKIAKSGYLPLTHAFFPLYPITIAVLSFVLQPVLSGMIISTTSFFFMLVVFRAYLESFEIKQDRQKWIMFALLFFPTSFYFLGVYTESLFMFLLIGSLYAMRKKKFVLAFILSLLAALTRFVGIFLIIPLFFELLAEYNIQTISSNIILSKLKKNLKPLLPLFGAPFGSLIYSMFLWKTTGDPIRFFNNLPDFQTGRQTDLILFPQVMYRYIKIFLTAQPNFQYFIAVVEFGIFIGVFTILTYDLWKIYRKEYRQLILRLGLNIFSFVNLLLPTFTGTFTSLPRYVLTSLSFFIVVGEMKNRWIKVLLLTIFGILHTILFIFFIQGYFVS